MPTSRFTFSSRRSIGSSSTLRVAVLVIQLILAFGHVFISLSRH
jgi:hypothetical protein